MRYPGLEDTKLGAEGLTGCEKFKLGMDIANAGMSMAVGGPAAFAAIQDVITVVQTVRMLQSTMASLKISYNAWATSVEEEQDVLLGNPFKPIPTEPVRLAYLHELKIALSSDQRKLARIKLSRSLFTSSPRNSRKA